jgi:hypothetical protein
VTCAGPCRATVILLLGRRVVARRTVRAGAAVRLKLTAAGRRELARRGRVALRLVASAPGVRGAERRITLAR